jgi:Holliday junction resolvase RusA-like endonuclease
MGSRAGEGAVTLPVTIVLLGEPVAWARARLGLRGIPFTPKHQRNNAATLRLAAQEAMDGRVPLDCAVRVDLSAEFSIPSSWSRKKQAAALTGVIRPTKRPDLSNVIKQVEDAFNGVVFRDDALIVEYGLLRKVYSTSPKLVVTVKTIGPPALPTIAAQPQREPADLFAEA